MPPKKSSENRPVYGSQRLAQTYTALRRTERYRVPLGADRLQQQELRTERAVVHHRLYPVNGTYAFRR